MSEETEITTINATPVPEPKALAFNPLAAMMSSGDLAASVAIEAQGRAAEIASAKLAAMAVPRDMDYVLARLKAECSNPAFAEQAIYAKPAGKIENEKTGKWEEKFVFGPSVRLLEVIANIYGNFKVKVNTFPPVRNCTEILVRTLDLQNTVEWEVQYAIPHLRWKKAQTSWDQKLKKKTETAPGEVIPVIEPDKIAMLVKSEMSKQIRSTISRAIPRSIIRQCMEWCDNTNKIQDLELLKDIPKCLETFQRTLKVNQAQLLGFLDIQDMKKFDAECLRRLRGLYQSIKEGEVDPADIFEGAVARPKQEKAAAESEVKSSVTVVKEAATAKQDKQAATTQPAPKAEDKPSKEGKQKDPEPPVKAAPAPVAKAEPKAEPEEEKEEEVQSGESEETEETTAETEEPDESEEAANEEEEEEEEKEPPMVRKNSKGGSRF